METLPEEDENIDIQPIPELLEIRNELTSILRKLDASAQVETPTVTSKPKGRRITWEDETKDKSRSQRKSSDKVGRLHIPRVYHSPAGPVTPTFHEVRNRF